MNDAYLKATMLRGEMELLLSESWLRKTEPLSVGLNEMTWAHSIVIPGGRCLTVDHTVSKCPTKRLENEEGLTGFSTLDVVPIPNPTALANMIQAAPQMYKAIVLLLKEQKKTQTLTGPQITDLENAVVAASDWGFRHFPIDYSRRIGAKKKVQTT